MIEVLWSLGLVLIFGCLMIALLKIAMPKRK
nr:MAG TPA: chitin synthase regulator [Caudoviricetes sp.]